MRGEQACLVSRGLVLSSEIVQKNPLCANRRRRAAVIKVDHVSITAMNSHSNIYIFPVYSSVVTRYLRSTCCKSTFEAPTLPRYRQVKNCRMMKRHKHEKGVPKIKFSDHLILFITTLSSISLHCMMCYSSNRNVLRCIVYTNLIPLLTITKK